MSPTAKPSHLGLYLVVAILLIYLIGYGVIRKECRSIGPSKFRLPNYLDSNETLLRIYQPLFILEGFITGKDFIWHKGLYIN